MINNNISIIGMGAVGVSVYYQLVKKLSQEKIADVEINLFEKNSKIGHGLAYANDCETNLLNRPANSMSVIHGIKSDFLDWLNQNNHWRNKYLNINITNTNNLFLPRSLFGLYLKSVYEKANLLARLHKIRVNVINDEAINLNKISHYFKITGKNNSIYLSNHVILALGHTQSKNYDHLKISSNYLDSPYPTTKLSKIEKNASIGIIGSRLSAIDAAVFLDSVKHQGRIAFISRHGYLPSVRSSSVHDIELKLLNEKQIAQLVKFGSLKLKTVINLILQEISLHSKNNHDFKEWFSRPYDAIQYLEQEINNVNQASVNMWQSIMIAINHSIEILWRHLNDKDKKIFLKRYKSKWMSYRVGIPYENANKIVKMMKEGQLASIKHLKSICFDPALNKFVIKNKFNDSEDCFDYVINATGFCSDLNHTTSLLLTNMINNGMLRAHQYGGIDIDFNTSEIRNSEGNIQNNLYAIGNLTEGTYFFTSVLERNVHHANAISDQILDQIKQQFFKYYIK